MPSRQVCGKTDQHTQPVLNINISSSNSDAARISHMLFVRVYIDNLNAYSITGALVILPVTATACAQCHHCAVLRAVALRTSLVYQYRTEYKPVHATMHSRKGVLYTSIYMYPHLAAKLFLNAQQLVVLS
jgi:hypothetical protein